MSKRKKLATIYEPQNKTVESILRRAHGLSGLKDKGTSFGSFILMSALRDATNMIELASKLMERENEDKSVTNNAGDNDTRNDGSDDSV